MQGISSLPLVSIIFPVFNGWHDTQKCLRSISGLTYPKNKIEVIIINNGSKTKPKLISKFKITFIENISNLGFAKAVNQGIRKASGEYVLVTNNDVVFEKNYLSLLVDFMEKKPIVGVCGGRVYYKKPKNKTAFCGARFNFYTGLISLGKTPEKVSETDWVAGCNMLVRKELFNNIGYFDECFFFYFEDLDFCLRAKKNGYQVSYFPKAIMYHGEGATIDLAGKPLKTNFYYKGKTRVLFKHADFIQLTTSLLFQFTLGLLFQIIYLKHQNYTAAIRGLLQKYLNFPVLAKSPPPEKLKDYPSVSIIFPTFNGANVIKNMLTSIKNQNYPFEKIEVIVVDNASTDGTTGIAKKVFPQVKLIKLPRNTGSAPPVSIAARKAVGDYILSTNDDVILDPNCLKELMQLALSDARIGIVTGKMLDLDPPHKPLFFGFRVNPYLGYHTYDFADSDKIRQCDWAPGACIFIDKKLFKAIGYFDNQYIFCGDDHDACFQVRSFGYKILYNPKAMYYHGFSRAKVASPTNLFAHYRGKIRFMIKNAAPLQIITFLPLQIFVAPIYTYFKFGHKIIIPLFRAIKWNILNFGKTMIARRKAQKLRNNYLQ